MKPDEKPEPTQERRSGIVLPPYEQLPLETRRAIRRALLWLREYHEARQREQQQTCDNATLPTISKMRNRRVEHSTEGHGR